MASRIGDLGSFLTDTTYLRAIIGLKVLPGRIDLQSATKRVNMEYLTRLNSFMVEQGCYVKKDA